MKFYKTNNPPITRSRFFSSAVQGDTFVPYMSEHFLIREQLVTQQQRLNIEEINRKLMSQYQTFNNQLVHTQNLLIKQNIKANVLQGCNTRLQLEKDDLQNTVSSQDQKQVDSLDAYDQLKYRYEELQEEIQGYTEKANRSEEDAHSTSEELNYRVRQIRSILDRFGVSDAAYHELAAIDHILPRLYLLKNCRTDINAEMKDQLEFCKTPKGNGMQVSVTKSLERIAQQLILAEKLAVSCIRRKKYVAHELHIKLQVK